jgi:hypothetical protein
MSDEPVLAPTDRVVPVVWVNLKTCMDVLGTYQDKVKQLAREGKIRVRQLPGSGTRPRYALNDVLTLAAESARQGQAEEESP